MKINAFKTNRPAPRGPAGFGPSDIYAVELNDGRWALVQPWSDAVGPEGRSGVTFHGVEDPMNGGLCRLMKDWTTFVLNVLEDRGLTLDKESLVKPEDGEDVDVMWAEHAHRASLRRPGPTDTIQGPA